MGRKVAELHIDIHRADILNANVSLHYHDKAKRVKRIRDRIVLTTEKFEEPPFGEFHVSVFVLPPTRRRLDPSNLFPTAKPILDGLTDNNWWPDDDWEHLKSTTFLYGGISGKKDVFTFIFIVAETLEDMIQCVERTNKKLEKRNKTN